MGNQEARHLDDGDEWPCQHLSTNGGGL
jgi:hypothetical protein